MLCCISGQVPREPVIARTNGCLYDRKLIERYVAENGRCPKTNEPLSKDDLIVVHTGTSNSQPSVQNPTSIPAMLQSLHNEWDALMLEQFTLRQQLSQCQQELSHALYQHDAGCRVIARLMRERDELRAKLSDNSDAVPGADAQEDDGDKMVIPRDVAQEIDETAVKLTKARKNREPSRTLARTGEIASMSEVDSIQSHSNRNSAVGVNTVCVDDSSSNKLVISGGADGKGVVYDVSRKTVASTLIGHTKAIRQVRAFDGSVVSASDDGTARLWRHDGSNYRNAVTFKGHSGAVTGVTPLPSQKYVLTCSSDGTIILSDVTTGVNIATGRTQESLGLSCVESQPDGFFAATGTASKVLIWDLKQMQAQHALVSGEGTITSLSFNQSDGVTIAAGTTRGVVQLWDTRSLDAPFSTITFDDSSPSNPTPVNRVMFDSTGTYLGVATNSVKVVNFRDRDTITNLTNHVEKVTDVAFGADCKWLASSSLDRTVRLYGSI